MKFSANEIRFARAQNLVLLNTVIASEREATQMEVVRRASRRVLPIRITLQLYKIRFYLEISAGLLRVRSQ